MSSTRRQPQRRGKKNELEAEYVSPYSLMTPRGRRRVSLLVILGGIALSHIWISDAVQDTIGNISIPTNGPASVQWSN